MATKLNIVISGKHNKPILVDVFYKDTNSPKPILIFCHGYKGFKDWGAWNLMAKQFVENGFCLVKFNFSHNGGTIQQPIDFPDLDAFGNNNYIKELDDLETVIDWVEQEFNKDPEFNTSVISLLGHSRGGGIVTIKAEEDSRIKHVISLAGVCDFGKRTSTIGNLDEWKNEGVKYVVNGRTKQNMPHFYQFYENFIANEERLTIKRAAQYLLIPHLIIHGDADTSVSIEEGKQLHEWNPKSTLKIIKGADHVFNCKHPWKKKQLTPQLEEVVTVVSKFIIT